MSTAAGAFAFLRETCKRSLDGDVAWLGDHLEGDLPGNSRLNDFEPDIMLGGLEGEHSPRDFGLELARMTGGSPCQTVASAHEVSDFGVDESTARGIVRGSVDAYRFAIDPAGGPPKLVELSYLLPPHPLPVRARREPYRIARERTTGSLGERGAALVDATLKTHPSASGKTPPTRPSSPRSSWPRARGRDTTPPRA